MLERIGDRWGVAERHEAAAPENPAARRHRTHLRRSPAGDRRCGRSREADHRRRHPLQHRQRRDCRRGRRQRARAGIALDAESLSAYERRVAPAPRPRVRGAARAAARRQRSERRRHRQLLRACAHRTASCRSSARPRASTNTVRSSARCSSTRRRGGFSCAGCSADGPDAPRAGTIAGRAPPPGARGPAARRPRRRASADPIRPPSALGTGALQPAATRRWTGRSGVRTLGGQDRRGDLSRSAARACRKRWRRTG